MASKNQIKLVCRLHKKRYRKQYGLFIVETAKVINELLNSNLFLEKLFITEHIFEEVSDEKKIITDPGSLKKMSTLTTPTNCLAVFKIPEIQKIRDSGLIMMLDDIRDPGNLGTIIRLCDWFGISQVICSETTADIYNPKVIQATMGSIVRVQVYYTDLTYYLKNTQLPIFGTFMMGNSIYKQSLCKEEGIIIMGNEANGISPEIEQWVTHRLTIPRFGNLQQIESLNVATATAIILSEFRRMI